VENCGFAAESRTQGPSRTGPDGGRKRACLPTVWFAAGGCAVYV